MIVDDRPKPFSWRDEIGWLALLLLVCVYFALSGALGHKQFLDLNLYAHLGERTPYQYRVLVAFLLAPIAGASPIAGLAGHFPGALKDPYVLVSCGINAVTLFGTVLVVRRTLAAMTLDDAFARWAAFLVPFMAFFQFLPSYGLNYVLPYDVPSLLFFALAFHLIVTRRRNAYFLVFVLGSLNREIMLFTVIPFAIWEIFDANGDAIPGGQRRAMATVAAQVALWIVVKLLVLRLFAGRIPQEGDAGLFAFQLRGNLVSILKPFQWPLLFSSFGFALPFLFVNRARIGDARLRRTLALMIPLWTLAMLVVGVVVEIRVFGELIVPVALGVATVVDSYLRQTRADVVP